MTISFTSEKREHYVYIFVMEDALSTRIAKRKTEMRKEPSQERSRATVDAVIHAAARILSDHGWAGFTTNRVAETAGVSIGSLYQYFPDKQAIYMALHERHVDEVRAAITQALAENASGSLEDFTRALVERLVNVHAADPQLHDLEA